MNRLSTAGFVPPSVYIGFRLFVFLERGSDAMERAKSSMRWRELKRSFFFLPDRPNGVLSYPALPRPAAPPCAAPIRPACGVFEFWIRQVSIEFRLFVLLENRSSDVSATSWRAHGTFFLISGTALVALNPARPCSTVPPGAPNRPARGMFGFWI